MTIMDAIYSLIGVLIIAVVMIMFALISLKADLYRFYELRLFMPDQSPDVQRRFRHDAHKVRKMIIRRFKALGYRDKETDESYISFERAVITQDRLYLKIAIRNLPDGLWIKDLISDANLEEVSIAIQRQITRYISAQSGAWLVVSQPGYEHLPESYRPYLDRSLDDMKEKRIPDDRFVFDDDLEAAAEQLQEGESVR